MRTIDGVSRVAGIRRDLAVLRRLAAMLFQYTFPGGRLRREYRRRERRNEVYWVDGSGPTRHREDAGRSR